MQDLEKSKQNIIAFYEMMFNECAPAKAIELYVGDEYIQHNPHVKDGKQGFIDYFVKMAEEYPVKSVVVKRALADGNFVVLHCHQIWPDGLEYAGMDIFRLDDNSKVVEHWDVLQEMPEGSMHKNGMF